MLSELGQYACKYAELGWRVFPLSPRSKEPMKGSHGVLDATCDVAAVQAAWTAYPYANIGLACGKGSGVSVVDVDIDPPKRVDGTESLAEFPALPKTAWQQTPRGGYHFVFKAKHPPDSKNGFRTGIDIRGDGFYVLLAPSKLDPYSGCPGGGAYEWPEGFSPWEIQPAEFPEFLRPQLETIKLRKVPAVSSGALVSGPSSSGRELISRYLSSVDPAVQGHGGHGKLLWAAQCMVTGCLLSDSAAYDILAREYNPRCSPPWDLSDQAEEKDFRRKIAEARRNPPKSLPVGWIINDPSYAAPDMSKITLHIEALLNEVHARQPGKEAAERAEKSAEIIEGYEKSRRLNIERALACSQEELDFVTRPTGMLGELCSWLNSTSRIHQPILSLGCALAFLGVLYGRKIKDESGSRTNLYCLGVGGSSSGKNHAPSQIRRLCLEAGCMELLGGNVISSDSALEERLSKFPATLFFWDEIGHALGGIKSGTSKVQSQLVPALMSIYSCAGDVYLGREYAEAGRQRIITEPCCCLYGTTTPDRFSGGISPEEIKDGWLGRVLTFYTDTKPDMDLDVVEQPVPESLITQCRAWMYPDGIDGSVSQFALKATSDGYTSAPPKQVVVRHSDSAKRVFAEAYKAAVKAGRDNSQMEFIWMKFLENAKKVALIVAASENANKPVVTRPIADYACRVIKYITTQFELKVVPDVVSSEIEHNKRKIFTVIEETGKKGCTKSDLTLKTKWANAAARNPLVADLIEGGEVVSELRGKTTVFYTTENWRKKSG